MVEIPPQMSNDRIDQMLTFFQRYYPGMQFFRVVNLIDFPIVYEAENLMHYLRGGAGPFVKTQVYTDIGVGYTLKAIDFESDEDGEEAEKIVNEKFHDMNVHKTIQMFDTFGRVLGRNCIVKTQNGDGSFYSNKKAGITGFDCINPMVLTYNSIQAVMNDTTGKAEYVQLGSDEIKFDQDRVIYHTNNDLSHRSVMGNSDLAAAITDLRTLARFPHYRNRMADNISNGFRIIKVDPQKLRDNASALAEMIFETSNGPQEYLDATAQFFTEQRKNGNDISVFDWVTVEEQSWRGKEPSITQAELDTIRSIGFKLGVPIELIGMGTDEVNRSTLETINDVYVSKSENGIRKHLISPILENLAMEILGQNDVHDGYLKVVYNPFLSKDLLQLAQIIQQVWPTGSMTKPEVRDMIGLDEQPDMGGDFWSERDALPDSSPMPAQTTLNVSKMIESKGLAKRL